jgi:hypothetical protein
LIIHFAASSGGTMSATMRNAFAVCMSPVSRSACSEVITGIAAICACMVVSSGSRARASIRCSNGDFVFGRVCAFGFLATVTAMLSDGFPTSSAMCAEK